MPELSHIDPWSAACGDGCNEQRGVFGNYEYPIAPIIILFCLLAAHANRTAAAASNMLAS
jgi:hypothetical protein